MPTDDLDFVAITREARAAASRRMRGRPYGVYDVDDIAQEMVVSCYLLAAKERIDNPAALLNDLAFKIFCKAVRREKKRRTQHPDFDRIADDCLIVQHWERDEVVEERVESLVGFAKNDVQRGLVVHASLGLCDDDPTDRYLMTSCLGVTGNHLAVQKHRLKESAREAGVRTAVTTCRSSPRCLCPTWKLGLLTEADRYRYRTDWTADGLERRMELIASIWIDIERGVPIDALLPGVDLDRKCKSGWSTYRQILGYFASRSPLSAARDRES